MPGRTVNGLAGPSDSRKRSRREAEDEEEVEIQHASSSLRSDGSKRARLSNAGSSKNAARRNQDETYSGASDDDEEMEDQGGIASPLKTQYEEMRDNDFRHLEHQEKDDYHATQMIRRNRIRQDEQVGDNFAALNGILESITCVNFMCHERLHCELGPLLNFIVGENGSGKSAILTAITLCLGGKASSTNRGGSLKNFVKEGCERASLIVKIKNRGDDGYRTDLYGDSIIVERHFSRSGGSGFKVKSEMGAVISTKKSEVDEIVEYYALQVDNPLNVLSQDNARQFLNAATPAQKYKYFIEGVQLEQLDRDYRLVQEFLEQSEAKVPLQQERVEILKKELREAEKANEAAKSNGQARRHLRLLRSQLVWSQVTDQELELATIDQKLVAADQEIAMLEEAIEAKATEMEQRDRAIDEKITEHAAAKQEDSEFDAGLQAVKNDYDEARKTLEAFHQDERAARTEAKTARDGRLHTEKQIEQEMRRLEEANGDKPIRLRQGLDQAVQRRKAMDEEVTSMKESIAALQNEASEMEQKCRASQQASKEANQAVDTKKREINDTRRAIDQLGQGQGKKYSAYPKGMEDLVRFIEHDTGFKEKPIGPIGTYVQLTKPEWSSILEKQIGILNDFIVTNISDQRRLQGLITKANLSPRDVGILIGNRSHIDTTGHEPDPKFDTTLRVLKFDNDVVRSQLIINSFIEQVILIKDRVEAQEVMFNGRPPKNVKLCFCEHDGKRNHGLTLQNKGGSISTNPIFPRNSPARMKTDVEAQVTAHREILEYLESELRDLQSQKEQVQQQFKAHEKELMQKRKEIQEQDRAVKRLERQILTVVDVEIQNIEAALDKYEGVDSRLDGLRDQLKEIQEKEEHYSTQYAELVVKKENYNKEVEARRNALRTEKERKREYERMVQDAENVVMKAQNLRRICLEEKNSLHQQLDSGKIERNLLVQKRQRQAEALENFSQKATELAPERVHIPEGQTHATIEAQYQAVRVQVAEAERHRGITDREAADNFIAATKAYDAAYQDLSVLKRINNQMKTTLQERLHKWRIFQRFVSSNARGQFASLLSERGYRGQLLLDHRNKTLMLRVETEKTEKNAAGKNTKSLSGGEKSFSSICLLLAIWDAMGSPLRCLDEFDVFMDNVNRAISTNMLISAARRSVGRQFILITPNAIEGRAKLEKDVHIIRLTDPRQRRLADP